MSQNIVGVNRFTNISGERNSLEDYSAVFRDLFSNEGILSGFIVTPTSPVSSSINVSAGTIVIDCGGGEFLHFRLKDDITGLAVPGTGSPKNYLVCLKINITSPTVPAEVVVVEGMAGVDPNLTEGGTPAFYYIVIARLSPTGANINASDITQDGVTMTNNSTPEIIHRAAVVVNSQVESTILDYQGVESLAVLHNDTNWGQYINVSDHKIYPNWRTTAISWMNRVETPLFTNNGNLGSINDNNHFIPRNAAGVIGGTWWTGPSILGSAANTTGFYQSSTLNESLEFQFTAEQGDILGIPDPSGGTGQIWIDGVEVKPSASWNGSPTVSVQIATFDGDFSAFTNSSQSTTHVKVGTYAQHQSQGTNASILAVGTYGSTKDLSASAASDFLCFWVYITNPNNVQYFQVELYFDATPTNFASIQMANLAAGWNFICVRRSQLTVTGTANWANVVKLAFRVRTNANGSAEAWLDDVKFVTPSAIYSPSGLSVLFPGHVLKIISNGDGPINVGAISMDASKRMIELFNVNRAEGGLAQACLGVLNGDATNVTRAIASMDLMCDLQLWDRTSTNRAMDGANGWGSIGAAHATDIMPGQRIVTDSGFAGIQFCLTYQVLEAAGLLSDAQKTKYKLFMTRLATYMINQGYNTLGYWNVGNSNLQFGFLWQLLFNIIGDIRYKIAAENITETVFIEGSHRFHMVKGTLAELFAADSTDLSISMADIAMYLDEHDSYTTLIDNISSGASQIKLDVTAIGLDNTSAVDKWVEIEHATDQVQIVRLLSLVSGTTWNVSAPLNGGTLNANTAGAKIYRTFDVGYSHVQLEMAAAYGFVSGDPKWVKIAKAIYNTISPLINTADGTYNNTGGSRQNTTSENLEFGLGGLNILSHLDNSVYPSQNLITNAQANLDYNINTYGTMDALGGSGGINDEFIHSDQGRASSYTWGVMNALKYVYGLDSIARGHQEVPNSNAVLASIQALTATTPLVYDNTTGIFSIPKATGSVNGYLSSTDWTTFNGKQDALGFTPENVANKSTNTSLGTSDTLYPTQNAVKQYVDAAVAGLLDYRGSYDASVNTFPASGGSGTAGAILKGDTWLISVAGTLGGSAVGIGDILIVNTDTPGQTAAKWDIIEGNIGYVPENVVNKGAASGYAPLDSSTKVPLTNLYQSSGSQGGYLSSSDWTAFNGKQAALTFGNLTEVTSSVLTITGGTGSIIGSGLTIQVKAASGGQNGYLSSTDWTTFNNKQPDLGFTPLDIAGSNNMSHALDMNTHRINNVTDPVSAQDAATKNYVDTHIQTLPYFTGNYYRPTSTTGSDAAMTITANRLYLLPFSTKNRPTHTMVTIIIRVTTGINGAKIHLGVFKDAGGGNATGATFVADAGEFVVSGVGAQDCTLTLGVSFLGQAKYYLGFVSDSAVLVNGCSTSNVFNEEGSTAASDTRDLTGYFIAYTYGALAGTVGTVTQTNAVVPTIKVIA